MDLVRNGLADALLSLPDAAAAEVCVQRDLATLEQTRARVDAAPQVRRELDVSKRLVPRGWGFEPADSGELGPERRMAAAGSSAAAERDVR